MSKEQLAAWLKNKKLGFAILVCPRCGKVDIRPDRHLSECDPMHEQYKMESYEYGDR